MREDEQSRVLSSRELRQGEGLESRRGEQVPVNLGMLATIRRWPAVVQGDQQVNDVPAQGLAEVEAAEGEVEIFEPLMFEFVQIDLLWPPAAFVTKVISEEREPAKVWVPDIEGDDLITTIGNAMQKLDISLQYLRLRVIAQHAEAFRVSKQQYQACRPQDIK